MRWGRSFGLLLTWIPFSLLRQEKLHCLVMKVEPIRGYVCIICGEGHRQHYVLVVIYCILHFFITLYIHRCYTNSSRYIHILIVIRNCTVYLHKYIQVYTYTNAYTSILRI